MFCFTKVGNIFCLLSLIANATELHIKRKQPNFAGMSKKLGQVLVYLCLVSLLLLNNTSHDFIHSFTGHEDTIDCSTKKASDHGHAFEAEHHHCSFLNYTFSVFDNTIIRYHFVEERKKHPFYPVYFSSFLSSDKTNTHLRGPPSIRFI